MICGTPIGGRSDYLDAPPTKVTAPHTPVPYSKPLEAVYIPDPPRIIAAVNRLLGTS